MPGNYSARNSNQACTPEEFVRMWKELGSPALVAKALGVDVRRVYDRRNRLMKDFGDDLRTWNDTSDRKVRIVKHEGRIEQYIENGVVIAFSDGHFWPGIRTTMFRALLTLIKQLKPMTVVCAGDSFDGYSISRFPSPFFTEGKPTVKAELTAVTEHHTEIEEAAGSADLIWCLGNHDLRFEAKLSQQVPEFQGIRGFHLKDWFPKWRPTWSFWVNEGYEFRHRVRGGVHAAWNNIHATHSKATITGHLHSLQVRPFTDARGGTKYGVDLGTLADPMGPQFVDYMEGRHGNWRSGFAVFTIRSGQMLMPELVSKYDEDHFEFRGHVLHADTGAVV